MSRGWWIAAALAALTLGGCGGGQSTAPGGSAPPPIPSPPSLNALGYALESGGRTAPRMLGEYPLAGTAPVRSFQEFGGLGIRFDPSGTLWSDQIGSFAGYRPDGSSAGTLNVQDELLSFDVRGLLYAASCCTLDVFAIGAGNTPVPLRSITTPSFACSAAADGAGDIFVAFCRAGLTGSVWSSLFEYGPDADGTATPLVSNATATGPVAVDGNGNVYAPYGSAVGIWLAGSFGAGAPNRTLPIPATDIVLDIAADRAGDAYVLTRTASSGISGSRTLSYFTAGSSTQTILLSGPLGSVAAVP